MLDKIVAPDGGVALFHDAHPPVEENGWFKTLCDVQDKFGRSEAPHVTEREAAAIAAMSLSVRLRLHRSWTACRSPSARP